MIAIITGGRHFHQSVLLNAALGAFHGKHKLCMVVDGAAKGADELAHQWAVARGILTHCVPADWVQFKRGAGPRRNAEMLKWAQGAGICRGVKLVVLAFEGGLGTAGMKRLARRAGVRVFEVQDRQWALQSPMVCGWCNVGHHDGPAHCVTTDSPHSNRRPPSHGQGSLVLR